MLFEESTSYESKIIIGVGHSLLSSWGAEALSSVRSNFPKIKLSVNSHRGKIALDRVSSGEYMVAFVPGLGENVPGLLAELICEEEMVIIPSKLKPFRLSKFDEISLLSSEPTETTWSSISSTFRRYSKKIGVKLKVVNTIQTFSAAAKLAEAGFGHAIVPMGVANSFRYKDSELVKLPKGGVSRPISIIGRKNTLTKKSIIHLIDKLRVYCKTSNSKKQSSHR